MKPFYAGVLGGAITIIIVCLLCIFFNNYHLYRIKIINPKRIDACIKHSDKYSQKMMLINDMERDGILLTPQEYTNYIITYYNTAITILVALFILFSIFSFFHFKTISKDQIYSALEDGLRDSKKFETLIMDSVAGKADDKYASTENLDSLIAKIGSLENTLNELLNKEEEEDMDGEIATT